ncbi:MAG: XRE family transcriptional regulator [Pseudonocardiales bacterium]|nr:helix-turn-helix domain-containing protein [Actinomycetota bacterium]PZS16702.1 MAG: XRE family transcriptional regulator [Pseudonocardiales bacterium]
MSPLRGPVVPRRRLGAELRTLREQADLTIEDVAKELECSVSKVSRLETGQGIPKSRDVRDLLDRYGITDEAHRDRLMRWVREGNRQGWWDDFSDVLAPDPRDPLLPDNPSRYVALEQDASELRSFETTLVHGLLQTEEYARAVFSAMSTADREATDRRVELRMRRQGRLYAAEDPLTVHTVLDEAVLRRQMGGEQVLRAQLKRLLADAQRPNITMQVLPFGSGAHPSVAGSFAVLAFPDSDDNDLVHIEGHLGDLYLEKDHDVAVYQQMFGVLVDMSMSAEQSAELLATIVQGSDD